MADNPQEPQLQAQLQARLRPVSHATRSGNVAVFCGHMFNTGSEAETALAQRIRAELDSRDITVGYGPSSIGPGRTT